MKRHRTFFKRDKGIKLIEIEVGGHFRYTGMKGTLFKGALRRIVNIPFDKERFGELKGFDLMKGDFIFKELLVHCKISGNRGDCQYSKCHQHDKYGNS